MSGIHRPLKRAAGAKLLHDLLVKGFRHRIALATGANQPLSIDDAKGASAIGNDTGRLERAGDGGNGLPAYS